MAGWSDADSRRQPHTDDSGPLSLLGVAADRGRRGVAAEVPADQRRRGAAESRIAANDSG